MSLGWATDQENPNLIASPNLDSVDGSTVPIHLDADLVVVKGVSNPTPNLNEIVTFTVIVANTGPANANNVEITDVLPAGLAYQFHSTTQGTYSPFSGLWLVGNLADGASATLTITAQVTSTGIITNTASVTGLYQPDPNLNNNTDSVSIYVGETPPNEADLSVLKYVDNPLPYEGSTITFTVTVINTGPATATNIQITDQLPNTVTYQSHSTTMGIYNSGTGIWAIPSLAYNTSATLTITATVNAGTAGSTSYNTATVTYMDQADPDLGDNSDTAEFFPTANEADLSVAKYVNNQQPYEGSTIIFTVVVRNTGPATATNIQITDHLPTIVTYQSHSTTMGTYNSTTGIWAISSLSYDSSATLTISATVNAGTAGSNGSNTATVTGSSPVDPEPANDSSTVQFSPRYPPAPARGVPPFPSVYAGIGAALGAGLLAYLVRRRLTA